MPIVYEAEVKYFFTMEFPKDALSLTGVVNVVKIFLNEEFLREILGVPVDGIKFVRD